MLTNQTRWSLGRGKPLVPSRWQATHTSIRRDRFQRRRAITGLSVLLVLAVIAAGIALTQQYAAEQQRNAALSREVAKQVLDLRDANPALAAQLGLAAYRLFPTVEARGSLLSTFANPYATRLTGHTGTVYSVAFSPDGTTLATASADTTARLWDIHNPQQPTLLGTLIGHASSVYPATFSPDGTILATGSDDKTARLWDIHNPQQPTPLGTLTGHTNGIYSVAFSPDGTTLATASPDTTARLWDIHNPQHSYSVSTLTGHTSGVRSVAFSPDKHTLVTTSADYTARLWDVNDPRNPHPLGTLIGHTSFVPWAAFSPDGTILATASSDRTARLWVTNVESVAARICSIAWPTITKNE